MSSISLDESAGRLSPRAPNGALVIDVAVVFRRQIVELAHVAARIPRIPLVGLGVPLDIERDCFPQAVQQPILEERLSQRDVAERRGLKQATEFLATRKIGAQGSAGAEIEKCGIGIGRDVTIARHSDRNQPVIGELLRGRIATPLAAMTGGAVALGRDR
jgi:hypothetical protein